LFLEGLKQHGKDWKKLSAMITTRSVEQIRTHAQKLFKRTLLGSHRAGKIDPGSPEGDQQMHTVLSSLHDHPDTFDFGESSDDHLASVIGAEIPDIDADVDTVGEQPNHPLVLHQPEQYSENESDHKADIQKPERALHDIIVGLLSKS
jgi:hypothetical protein